MLGAKLYQASGSDRLQLGATSDKDKDNDTDTPHRYKFTFVLPKVCPGIINTGGFFSNYNGQVKYKLQARVDRPGKLYIIIT